MDAIQKAFKEAKTRTTEENQTMNEFGMRLHAQFDTNVSLRRPKEMEWLESLRQYKGLYDPSVKLDPLNSKVYPKLTRSKVNIVLSRLHEMLFPEIERNWMISVRKEPRISKEVVKALAAAMVATDEQGNQVVPSINDLRLAIKAYADTTCQNMADQIDDQFLEMEDRKSVV